MASFECLIRIRPQRFSIHCREHSKETVINILKHILLIEDDPMDVELILHALSENHLANEVAVARDGVEALDYLYRRGSYSRRPAGDPVLIMLDLKMPRLDGIQVLQQLKADDQFRMIPIVILSSSSESLDLKKCCQLGANAYVVKPVNFLDFVQAVKRLGVFWILTNQPWPNHGSGK